MEDFVILTILYVLTFTFGFILGMMAYNLFKNME